MRAFIEYPDVSDDRIEIKSEFVVETNAYKRGGLTSSIEEREFANYVAPGSRGFKMFKELTLEGSYLYRIYWEEPMYAEFWIRPDEVEYMTSRGSENFIRNLVEMRAKAAVNDARSKQ